MIHQLDDSDRRSWLLNFSLKQKGVIILFIITLLFIGLTAVCSVASVGPYAFHRYFARFKLVDPPELNHSAYIIGNPLLTNIHLVGTSAHTFFFLSSGLENSTSCDSSDSACENDADNTDEENALKMILIDRASIRCFSKSDRCKLFEPEESEEPATTPTQWSMNVNVNSKVYYVPDTSTNFVEAAYQCYNARKVETAYFQTNDHDANKACGKEFPENSNQCPEPFNLSVFEEPNALEEVQTVLVVGRASDSGDHSSNLELGSKRAKGIGNIIAPMLEEGVKVQTESLGELFGVLPSGSNDPAERRVDIFVCEDAA